MKLIKRFVLSEMGVNCFLIEANGKVILIDAPAGCNRVTSYLDQNDLKLDFLLITHIHFDHILGAQELIDGGYIDSAYVAPNEIDLFNDNSPLGNMGANFGAIINFTGSIRSLDELNADELGLRIEYIEGHSKQSAIFIFDEEQVIFSGDTLFKDSIGGSDFPHGDYELLKNGILTNIMSLDDYKVYPGHGFATNTNAERNNHLLYN